MYVLYKEEFIMGKMLKPEIYCGFKRRNGLKKKYSFVVQSKDFNLAVMNDEFIVEIDSDVLNTVRSFGIISPEEVDSYKKAVKKYLEGILRNYEELQDNDTSNRAQTYIKIPEGIVIYAGVCLVYIGEDECIKELKKLLAEY